MTENKTKPTAQSVDDFLAGVKGEQKRADSKQLVKLMQDITGQKPVMWGKIIGFGKYTYKYASGREGEWMKIGFSPRAQALTVYGIVYYDEGRELLDKLGKVTTGKGCVYIKKLSDVNLSVLRQMIERGYKTDNPYSS